MARRIERFSWRANAFSLAVNWTLLVAAGVAGTIAVGWAPDVAPPGAVPPDTASAPLAASKSRAVPAPVPAKNLDMFELTRIKLGPNAGTSA
ncbi:MAG: hypothetical protein JHC87_04875 [Thermoleophilaceae bacterium]|nr:hypothetical protein [Thermoleophilaceae bacterium]